MEFLDKSILPQSAHHMILLKYLIVLSFVLLIPYLSLLFGSLASSLYFRKRAVFYKNDEYYKVAEDLIEMMTFNKSVAFALGIIPLLSSMFGFAQLLNGTTAGVPGFLFISGIFLINALLLIYSYRKGFYTRIPKEESTDEKNLSEADARREEKRKKAILLFGQSGYYGIILLVVTIYLLCGAVLLASDTTRWASVTNIFDLVFSLETLVYFLQFIAIAYLLTSSMILYRIFRANAEDAGYSSELKNELKNFSLKRGLVSSILLPLFIVLSVMLGSKLSLSFTVFGLTVVLLALVLAVSSLYYVMIKESSTKYNSAVLYLMVVIVLGIIIRDQYSFDVASKKQYAVLSANYDAYQLKINEQLGIGGPAISGADIYNGRCIACHNFDKKVVGPPYNETMPKYEGKKDLLVKFIMSPVKVNPNYPAMPNQGLKPKEAEAIADYLLTTYKKK